MKLTDEIKEVLELSEAKRFLAREFLTWLWYESETKKEPFSIKSSDKSAGKLICDIWVDDKIVFEASGMNAMKQTFIGGVPSQSKEVALALQTGKNIGELRVGLHVDGMGDFHFNLAGSDLSIRSLRLPEIRQLENLEETDGALYILRLEQIATVSDIIDGLFGIFLGERVKTDWSATKMKDIKSWVHQRTVAHSSSVN